MEKYDRNLEYKDKEVSASSKQINLELIFTTRVRSPVYTGRKIIGEVDINDGSESIKIMLVDSHTRKPVITGRVASLKVKIVLICGDFCGVGSEDDNIWTHREFKNNIVVKLEKKKNLLLGDLSLVLKSGSGTVGEIRIKHDSKPLKNVKFRLGAMVDDDCPCEIKEAITNVFDVKDRRNESKLSKSLSPKDCVSQIINISKKGGKRLEREHVFTVMDFLNMHYYNAQGLKEICGIKGKKWEMTINHAKTSLFENMHNAYEIVRSTSQQSNTVSFVDYDGSNRFWDNCYKPHLCINDYIDNMVVDYNFSVQDMEICDAYFREFEPCQANQEGGVISASSMILDGVRGGGDLAKKRWMKLRATIWFWMVSFTKKVRLCIAAP